MKTKLLIASILLSVAICTSQQQTQQQPINKATAIVDQVEGIYVFVDSKPVAETNYLGSVSITFSVSGDNEELKKQLVKKAKSKYATAQAIIINSASFDKAEVISFK